MSAPTTARNDVSGNEMALRKLDQRDRTMRAFETIVLIILILINIAILFNITQLATKNAENIVDHRERDGAVHRDLENLICDIIINRPAINVTDGQRKACQGKGTN